MERTNSLPAQGVTDSGVQFDGCYKGRIAVYEHGKRLWTKSSGVERISRGDALLDAQRMAHDLAIQNFLTQS